MNLQSAL